MPEKCVLAGAGCKMSADYYNYCGGFGRELQSAHARDVSHLRRRQKKLVTAAVVSITVLVIAFARVNGHSSLVTSIRDTSIEADGAATTLLEVYGAGRDPGALKITSSDPSLLRVDSVESSNGRVLVRLRAGVLPGEACVRIRTLAGVTREVAVTLTPSFSDSYQDGTPDFLRLGDDADAESFRRWFAFLSESQFFLQPKLPREVNDCASLLRFAYRESLRRHDGEWAAALSLPRLPELRSGAVQLSTHPSRRVFIPHSPGAVCARGPAWRSLCRVRRCRLLAPL